MIKILIIDPEKADLQVRSFQYPGEAFYAVFGSESVFLTEEPIGGQWYTIACMSIPGEGAPAIVEEDGCVHLCGKIAVVGKGPQGNVEASARGELETSGLTNTDVGYLRRYLVRVTDTMGDGAPHEAILADKYIKEGPFCPRVRIVEGDAFPVESKTGPLPEEMPYGNAAGRDQDVSVAKKNVQILHEFKWLEMYEEALRYAKDYDVLTIGEKIRYFKVLERIGREDRVFAALPEKEGIEYLQEKVNVLRTAVDVAASSAKNADIDLLKECLVRNLVCGEAMHRLPFSSLTGYKRRAVDEARKGLDELEKARKNRT